MERAGTVYISRSMTLGELEYILNNEVNTDDIKTDKLINLFIDRIEGRYFTVIKTLLDEHDIDKNGFAIMALECLLVETLLQFRRGLKDTRGCSKQKYSEFLCEHIRGFNKFYWNNLEYNQPANAATLFYENIRCGILHSGQTKNGSVLTTDKDYVVDVDDKGCLSVNIESFCNELYNYFSKYVDELQGRENVMLKKNFIKKFIYITKGE